MQNNLSKENFGIPVTILCAIAYALSYAASGQFSWAILAFVGIVFAFTALFLYLIFNSLKGKYIHISFIDKILGNTKIKCSGCGAEVSGDSSFCTKCGHKIK